MARNLKLYFCSIHFILKILQIIFAGIILALILWEASVNDSIKHAYLMPWEEFTATVCCVCMILNVINIILEACGVQCTCAGCSTRYTYHLYYLLMLLAFVATTTIEVLAAHSTANQSGWKNYHARRASAAALTYVEVILFALCLWFGPGEYVSVTVR